MTNTNRDLSSSTPTELCGASPGAADEVANTSRRAFATVFGALGALVLSNCADRQPGALEADRAEPEDLEELRQLLTVATPVWKMADTAANLRTITGGTTSWVAALQGIATASDGGGGIFYWSTSAKADDGWSVLNASAGNSAGWRRVHSAVCTASSATTLRAIPGSGDRGVALLSGLSSAGDGGGGVFAWTSDTTSADNGDGVIVPTPLPRTGCWKRVHRAPDGLVASALATRAIPRNGEALTVVGRASAGDGAAFVVYGETGSATPVDNVNVFTAPNGRYKRAHGFGHSLQFGREVNLAEDFGVVADGTDQSARLQAAFDWYNQQADAWFAANPGVDSYAVMPFYLPGASRAVKVSQPITLHGGNHKKIVLRGDGYHCANNSPYGHAVWQDLRTCAGSALKADGDFDIFEYPDNYTYLDVSRVAFGNAGQGACLRASSLTARTSYNVVIRANDIFCYGGKVGYWSDIQTTCYSVHDLMVRGCQSGIKLGDIGLGTQTWDTRFYGIRVEGCNNAIELGLGASITFYGGLVQGNGKGIYAPANYTLANGSFHTIHFESNGVDFDVSNTSSGTSVVLSDCRIANFAPLQVPFCWSISRIGVSTIDWYTTYGPNRATLELRGVSAGTDGITVDFSNGTKRAVGSLPTPINAATGTVNINAMKAGDFVTINLAGNITLAAPTKAPQGLWMRIRLRQDGVGGRSVAFSGFVSGTGRYSNAGNASGTEGWLVIAFDDLNQWSVVSWTGWAA